MNSILRITDADGFYQFALPANLKTRLERSKLSYVNRVWRNIQELGLGPDISFRDNSDPYLQYRLAAKFLSRCTKSTNFRSRISSKGTKHQIEAITPEPFYVGQAYVILAARCLGFEVRPTKDRLSYHLNIVSDDHYWSQARWSDWN